MDKRYYKKKGATYKDRIRCPLCGKISAIINFSMDHLFGVFRYWFCGYGDIRCEMIDKDPSFMTILREDLAKRLLELLEDFSDIKWFSQDEVNDIVADHERMIAMKTLMVIPRGVSSPSIRPRGIRAHNVVIVK